MGATIVLNYGNLNDVEFEYLCQDIMQKKLGVVLHRFARGRDGGIDLTDQVNTKNIVVQVKHYMSSSAEQLMAALKKEAGKVRQVDPGQYYLCCSKELSPGKVNDIYLLFSDYMDSPSNILTLNEIDDFLNDPANLDILEKHYKLWIESTGILQDVANQNIFVDCESLLADIETEKNLFVKTSAFANALKCLQDNRTLFITGNPGVGKTITSKMLVLYYAARGYRVRFSTNVSDIDALKKSLSKNPDVKEIILIDDCFGQAYFNMKESQNAEIISLINYVNSSAEKLLILNSRITILKEAKEQKPELVRCFEKNHCRVYLLDMSAMDDVEKAKIFYNHIVFNGMDEAYFSEIKKDRRYRDIVRHPNYTPRIIEFICNPNRYRSIALSRYYEFAMRQLDNPREIWKDEYERKLGKTDRLFLLTIYSLSDTATEEWIVRECFEHRIAQERDIDTTIDQYEASLARLLDGFVRIVAESGVKKLSMVNPSVNDYLDGRLEISSLERQQLIERSYSIRQKKRLLPPSQFDDFVRSMIVGHEIDRYLFDDEDQKDAFITYYIGKYKILDVQYTGSILRYLRNPGILHIPREIPISAIRILRQIFCAEICEFYKIEEYMAKETNLENLLYPLEFEPMVETVILLNRFFDGANRPMFVRIVSEHLREAIEEFCDLIDANDYIVNVDTAVHMASDGSGSGYGESVDVDAAISYIEDKVISQVIDKIEDKLLSLPMDIESDREYTADLSFSIYGAAEMVDDYLNIGKLDQEYCGQELQYDDADVEIDYIFDRTGV